MFHRNPLRKPLSLSYVNVPSNFFLPWASGSFISVMKSSKLSIDPVDETTLYRAPFFSDFLSKILSALSSFTYASISPFSKTVISSMYPFSICSFSFEYSTSFIWSLFPSPKMYIESSMAPIMM